MKYHQHLCTPLTAEDAEVLNFIIRKHGDESMSRLYSMVCMHNDFQVMYEAVEIAGQLRYEQQLMLEDWAREQYEADMDDWRAMNGIC